MKPSDFQDRLGATLGAALADLDEQLAALKAKNAAAGVLNSGGTIRAMARISGDRARRLAAEMLNDYEAAKRWSDDEELRAIAQMMGSGFASTALFLWRLQRLSLPTGALKAAEALAKQIVTDVNEQFERHRLGLPVDGVTRREVPEEAKPWFRPLERWGRANPTAAAIVSFLAGALVTGAAALLGG